MPFRAELTLAVVRGLYYMHLLLYYATRVSGSQKVIRSVKRIQ